MVTLLTYTVYCLLKIKLLNHSILLYKPWLVPDIPAAGVQRFMGYTHMPHKPSPHQVVYLS